MSLLQMAERLREILRFESEFISSETKENFLKDLQIWNCLDTSRKLLPITAVVMQYYSSCLEHVIYLWCW